MVYKEIYKLAKTWIILAIFSLLILFAINLNQVVSAFKDQVQLQKNLIAEDLYKIHTNYMEQLKVIRNEIEKSELNADNVNRFFKSEIFKLFDRSNVSTIVVTDNKNEIIYADGYSKDQYINTDLTNRKYLQDLSQKPEEIIVGDIVLGGITKKFTIPIAVSINDNNRNMKGAIIFSISLENLSNNLNIFIAENIDFVDNSAGDYLSSSGFEKFFSEPIKTFVEDVLLTNKTTYDLSFPNNFGNNHTILRFSTKKLKQTLYLYSYIPDAIAVVVLLVLIALLFNYYIFRPLLPAMFVASRTTSNKLDIKSSSRGIFTVITEIIKLQYSIQEENNRIVPYKLELKRLTYFLHKTFNCINNSLETLSEDIGDLSQSFECSKKVLEESYLELFEQIYQSSLEKGAAIKGILEIIDLSIRQGDLRNHDLINLMIQSGINRNLIKIDSPVQSALSYMGYDDEMFMSCFMEKNIICLFSAIFFLVKNIGSIVRVTVSKTSYKIRKYDYYENSWNENRHEFVIKLFITTTAQNANAEISHLDNDQINKCRIWALANLGTFDLCLSGNSICVTLTLPITRIDQM